MPPRVFNSRIQKILEENTYIIQEWIFENIYNLSDQSQCIVFIVQYLIGIFMWWSSTIGLKIKWDEDRDAVVFVADFVHHKTSYIMFKCLKQQRNIFGTHRNSLSTLILLCCMHR